MIKNFINTNDSKRYGEAAWASTAAHRMTNQKCNAGSMPTVFVGELVRANAKGLSVVEQHELAWKSVRQRVC